MVYDTRNLKDDSTLKDAKKIREYRDAFKKFGHRKVLRKIYNVVLMISFKGEAPIYKEPEVTEEIEEMWRNEEPVTPDGDWTEQGARTTWNLK